MSVPQSVASRYIKEEKLLRLLQRLFPGTDEADFNIRLADDRWSFTAPSLVAASDIDTITEDH
ncbi:hypothetical protein F4821DRAFT_257053 [Hypoxylon rubiginosum]|uniref:Uncharacterized protein n=1 Tax=Hypoxylon rubiginosum TaxID=110542 RepID=A0ACC0D928_9PEZI|nr:hypothetical protein F4821DRAFT_257053 [Hypoxylon rubiginosum]